MYLKKLEIQGFKSFPDKIVLTFGPGITSIVGPNGSGKSNISDAVRWVLGEQSAKILRGSKMEDIIFAGTELRKPLGFAEVSLTIDNSSKILPIDFKEVTVTRRVYRSGESEYYINKSACRLKNIHELFMDTGLGKDGYSIIGQGRIDEILSTKSEDRRQVFEEAAGITKYKFRKQEAEKKLELTRQNLIRIKDIINELELQLDPLREQAEKAKKFLNLSEQLKVSEINICLHIIEKLKKNLNEVNENYEILCSQLTQSQSDLQKLEHQVEELYTYTKNKEKEIEEIRNNLHSIESTIKSYTNEVNIWENNIENNIENLKKINLEVQNTSNKIINFKEELFNKHLLLEKLLKSQQEANDHVKKLEKENKKIIEAMESENLAIDSLKSEVIEIMNSISETKVKINSLKVLDKNFIDRKNYINKDIEEKNKAIAELNELNKHLEQKFASMQLEIKQKQRLLEQSHNEINNKRKEHEVLKNRYNERISVRKEKESKKFLLEEMEKDYDGYSKSVKNVLLEWKNGRLRRLNIYGALSQLIDVPKQFVTAIEIALGSAMQNIVVETEQDAKMAIEFLKLNHLGRATFLPISSVNGNLLQDRNGELKDFPGYLGLAAQCIHFDSKYQGIINSLLGRVVIVDNIDNGINMAKKFGYRFKIVTLQGDILNAGGSLSGGSINKVNSFLSRRKEINELNQEILSISSSIDKIGKDILEKDKEINALENNIQVLEQSLKEYEGDCIALESDIKHNRSILDNHMQNKNLLFKEKEQLNEQIESTANEIQILLNSVKTFEDEIKRIEDLISQKQADYKEEMEIKERLTQEILDKKLFLGSINKDIDLVNERIKALQYEINEFENNKNRKNQEYIELQKKNETLREQITVKAQNIQALENRYKLLQDKLEQCSNEKKQAEQNINVYQLAIKDKRENISLLQQEYHRIENKKLRIELELENNVNKLWDEYELTFTSALEYKKDIENIAQVQKNINALKNEIKALGNVNVNAIEEYKNTKERYEFLCKQRDDLEEAEIGLVKIITDMLNLMKKQFSNQFQIINENFKIVFKQLFGGGKAELKLAEPNNVLESGIEIEVQPPGKKLQNLMLLSGGEKAFTAIALLFAILKVRPTPFCILDEIEAALDDVNVYRFAQYLKKYSQQTQFIIITHRRGTMETADILYGVTMQEHGVSKLISLKIDEIAS